MQRTIVASAFLSLAIPLSAHAQTIVPQVTTCTQTDPVAFAACAANTASTTPATTSTTTPATPSATTTTPAEIPVTPSAVSVREALTTWLQKNTPIFLDAQSWLNVGILSANEDPASASSVITNLQKALDQNTFILPTSFYTPKTGSSTAISTSSSASTSPEVQAEITLKLLLVQELLKRIEAIKAAMSAPSAPASISSSPTFDTNSLTGSSFTRTLQLGSEGSDVQRLQQFLAQDPAIYPEGRITGYFGPLTRAAVGRWQIARNIIWDESTAGFGIVGPKTRAAITEWINSGSTTASTPSNTSSDSWSSNSASIAPSTQSNTPTSGGGSSGSSNSNTPLSAPAVETSTSNTSPAPANTSTATTPESETVDTLPPETEIVDVLPPEEMGS